MHFAANRCHRHTLSVKLVHLHSQAADSDVRKALEFLRAAGSSSALKQGKMAEVVRDVQDFFRQNVRADVLRIANIVALGEEVAEELLKLLLNSEFDESTTLDLLKLTDQTGLLRFWRCSIYGKKQPKNHWFATVGQVLPAQNAAA